MLSFKKPIDVELSLIEALQHHQQLEEFSIICKLKCSAEADYERVRNVFMRSLENLPQLRNFLLKPIGFGNVTEKELNFKRMLI